MWVLHRCDNPPCVNPAHLFLGTSEDNIQDCIAKGRHAHGDRHPSRTRPDALARGERHWSKTHPERVLRGNKHPLRIHPDKAARGEKVGTSKLSEEQVIEMRSMFESGCWTKTALGAHFGVTRTMVGYIVNRQCWKHVGGNDAL
jgi:hypothetical protein